MSHFFNIYSKGFTIKLVPEFLKVTCAAFVIFENNYLFVFRLFKLFVKPQTLNEFTIISLEMLSHALTIQPTITSKDAGLGLPAAVYYCFPVSNQSSNDFV